MKSNHRKHFAIAVSWLAAFVLWTAAVCRIDVQPIGPLGSSVGFAALNRLFHRLTGVHMALYDLTDRLSLIPLGFVCGFGCLGLRQWIRRRKLSAVDFSILVLGGFYLLVLAVFLPFEFLAVNYRPVLINGIAEASYPSSTTMLVMCIMPTAMLQLRQRIRHPQARKYAIAAMAVFTIFMVLARLISGVHWLTDIIGGIMISAGLVELYRAVCCLAHKENTGL